MTAIAAASTLLLLPLTVVSLDVPVSHVMLLDRSTDGNELIGRNDGLYRASIKLWKKEGWRGFTKGVVPFTLALVLSSGTFFFTETLLNRVIAKRHGAWAWVNSGIKRVICNIVLGVVLNPALILWTRMRLSPVERKTKEEFHYLWLRMSWQEWFSLETVLPGVLRYTILDSLLGASYILSSAGTTFKEIMWDEVWRGNTVKLLGSIITMPLLRCQEMAAVHVKPLDSSIPIADYNGIGDEIVRDSAWDGLSAPVSQSALGCFFNLVMNGLSYAIGR